MNDALLKDPVFYCKELLQSDPGLNLSPVTLPNQMVKAFHEIRSLCSGFLGNTQTIQYFFKMLGHSGIDKHSVYRERFWRKYLDAGFISQSWLILAPGAEKTATKELNLKPWQYGRLHKTRRVDTHHMVLLMRLDHLLIAEWSHIGKCRIWYQSNLNAPSLFRKLYSKNQLADYSDHIQQHYFASKGLWQKDLAAWMSAKAFIPDCYSEKLVQKF